MNYVENSNLDRLEKRLKSRRQEDFSDDYFESEEAMMSIKVSLLWPSIFFPLLDMHENGPLCTYFVLHELSVSMEASGASTQKGFSKFLVGSVVKPLCKANLFIKFSQKLCTLYTALA